MLGGRFLNLLLSAVTSVLIARYLGRERMGLYGALFAYVSLFSFFSTAALDQILAREVSVRRDDAAQLFHTSTILGLVFSILGTLMAFGLAPKFGYSGALQWLVVVAAIDLMILSPLRQPGIIFQVEMRQWIPVVVGVTRQLLWLAALALLALRSAVFYHVILARTLCGVIETVILLFLVRRPGFIAGRARFSWTEAKRLLRYAFPLALGTIAAGIFQRVDQVMLHNMTGDKTLGPYVVAVQLTEQFSALPIALASSLFPVLARSADQEELFRYFLGVSYRFLMSIVFFACAVVTPITGSVVRLLYGGEFLATAQLINVLIWSEAPVFLGVILTNALIAKNLQRYLPFSTLIGAAMNIGLNLLFIPRWGALGAAWATVISYAFATVLLYVVFPPSRAMTWLGIRTSLPPFGVALIIAVALHYWAVHFSLKFVVAVVAYSAGVWLTGTVRRADIDRLMQTFRSAFRAPRGDTA